MFHDDPRIDAAGSACDPMRRSRCRGPRRRRTALIEQRIPAGRYAARVHKGGYEGLPGAWTALKKEWLPKSGQRMSGPSYELYLNDPMSTPKAELLTEIYMRLA